MHGRIPRLVLVAPIVAVLALTVMASRTAALGGAETPALKSISSRLDGTVSTVLIEASEPVAYLTSQPDPLTVLVDLRNVNVAGLSKPAADLLAPVSAVAVESAVAPDGAPVARVRVRLDRAARHRVRSSRNTILVELDRNGPSGTAAAPAMVPTIAPVPPAAKPPVEAAPATPAAAEKRPSTSLGAGLSVVEGRAAATELRAVRFAKVEDGFAVTLAGNGPLVAATVEDAKDLPHRVLLDFHGVAAGSAPAITSVKNDDVNRIRVATNSRSPLVTRVVIDLARKLPYTVEQIGEDLRVMFKRAADGAAAMVMPAAAAVAPAKIEEPVVKATPDVLPSYVTAAVNSVATSVAERPVVAADAAPVPPAAAAPPMMVAPARISTAPLPVPMPSAITAAVAQPAPSPLQQPANQAQRQFSGDPVTLDFQGADLRAVLRTFAEISNGLNIIIDPSIQGTVDVSLRDVPWDQALDIILRSNKLGYSVEGNIVRIVPLNVLAQENEERRKLSEAQSLAGELRTLTVPVSYAKANDLVAVITRSTLSARGDVQVDARTNTLIIRDLGDRIAAAAELVRTLDRPQPQVEIEARIVQLNRNAARELGIQWGFNGNIDPQFGTSTGVAFPSSANLSAATGAVNPANQSAIGLALGSINGALNIDVSLRAMESEGRGRILSTPRVATQNNVEAEITQGSQIPIQTVSNNTVTVTFKDAALTLRVTPQITASNTVIMRIFVEKAAPNYTQTSAAQPVPSIDTQRAVTSVLMGDGETTVIGGIYTREESDAQVRTPFLHRLPLLGWLFKTDRHLDDSDELLIFITPRIAK
jgi:type IV pilus assembly protein PilQ